MQDKGKFYSCLAVFAVSFFVYIATIPSTIFLGDNAEFITAGSTLGVPHPPGFPLYVLLAKLFSFLPFGTVVFKINLLSAVSATVALVFFNLILYRLLDSHGFKKSLIAWFSAPATLILAFSDIFWEQAITAETYSLNVLFTMLGFWLILRYWQNENPRLLLWLGLVFGLACANHPMFALFLPFFIVGILLRRQNFALKHYTSAIIAFVFGLGLYFVLPLMSSRDPVLDWGNTEESMSNFINHLTRAQYSDLGVGSAIGDKMQYLVSAFYRFVRQFGALLLAVPFGLYGIYRVSKKLLFLSGGIFLANIFGIILLRDVPFSFDGSYFYATYYTPAYTIVAFWIASGLGVFVSFVNIRLKTALAASVLGVALPTLFAGLMLFENHDKNNLRDFSFIEDFSQGIIEHMDEKAVLVISSEGMQEDTFIFSLLYQRVIQGLRPDIEIVSFRTIFPGADAEKLDEIYRQEPISLSRLRLLEYTDSKWGIGSRPVYTTFIFDGTIAGRRLVTDSNGYLYHLHDPGVYTEAVSVPISEKDERILLSDYTGRDFLAYYYLTQASGHAQKGDRELSQEYYIKAIGNDNDISGADLQNYKILRDRVLLE